MKRRENNRMVSFFFYPKTIAVIGATNNPKKFGNAVTINLLNNSKPQSELFLVSHQSQEISGVKCYKSILEISKDIDVAIILVPARVIDDVIDQCIKKRVKGIIIITAGFGEINENGKIKEFKHRSKCIFYSNCSFRKHWDDKSIRFFWVRNLLCNGKRTYWLFKIR